MDERLIRLICYNLRMARLNNILNKIRNMKYDNVSNDILLETMKKDTNIIINAIIILIEDIEKETEKLYNLIYNKLNNIEQTSDDIEQNK